jgi:succinate dehydrogenase/fumarate reductase cytochrome b subunit
MTAFSAFYRSSIGKKMIVALTGVILMLFVIGHLLGNLQIFLGPRWVNDYAQHLRDLGPLLWLIRITLLTAVFLHIYFTVSLVLDNRRARPQRYQKPEYIKASYASRHMVVSWPGRARLYRFSPAPFYRPEIQCPFSDVEKRSAQSLRRLFDDGLRIPKHLRLGLLHHQLVFAYPSSHPWRFKFFPIAWPE